MTVSPPTPAGPPWNVLAIVGFVLAFVVPPGAIVCGHIALSQLRTSGEQGRGLALAGTIMGYVFTGLIALFVILWIGFFLSILGLFASVFSQLPTAVPSTTAP